MFARLSLSLVAFAVEKGKNVGYPFDMDGFLLYTKVYICLLPY
jgi:hypothetical protein